MTKSDSDEVKTKQALKMAYVEWMDKVNNYPIKACGFVLCEDSKNLYLGLEYDEEKELIGGLCNIPVSSILNKVYLSA